MNAQPNKEYNYGKTECTHETFSDYSWDNDTFVRFVRFVFEMNGLLMEERLQ